MRVPRIIGYLTSAAALLGCVPGTLAYGDGVWAGVRQSVGKIGKTGKVGKVLSGPEHDADMHYQNIEPRAKNSDPPYGSQSPPLTDKITSSESSTSTWDGEMTSSTSSLCQVLEGQTEARVH